MHLLPNLRNGLVAFAAFLGVAGVGFADTPETAYKATSSVIRPAIISAEEWGSKRLPIPEEKRQVPARITVHHAGSLWKPADDPDTRIRNLQSWGQREKKWEDLPYHFLIAPDGRIYEGRDINFAPETNTNYVTSGHIGIQLWGNFEEQRVSLAQLQSTVNLIAWLGIEYGISAETISGHKDVAEGTVCPGKDFHRYIASGLLKRWVLEAQDGLIPGIHPLPALEDGPTEVIAEVVATPAPAPEGTAGKDAAPVATPPTQP